MAISKVIYGEDTLIDLSADTVTAQTLAAGATAHNSAGETVVGTVTMLTVDEITQQAALKVDKDSLGLNNVDNTSDMDKPVSTAQQAALAEKAPAGYGFGEPAEIAEVGSEEELFAFLEQMFQKCPEAGAKKVYIYFTTHVGSIPATSCFIGNVYRFGTMVGGFTGYSYINGFAEISIQRYDTWQAIDWSNPPMFPSVEYRTTERHNGKPVFVKRIYTGYLDLPMNFIVLESTTEFIEDVVDLSYFITQKTGQGAMYTALTYCQRDDLTIFFNNDVYPNSCEATVFMETTGNLSDYTGYVTVKYTKQSF